MRLRKGLREERNRVGRHKIGRDVVGRKDRREKRPHF